VHESSPLIRTEALWKGDVGGVLEPSGCETLTAWTFPADAAVGLLSRERSTLQGMLRGGGGGETLQALASEVAVGANKLVVGRGDHEADRPTVCAVPTTCFDDAVFGWAPGVADGVRDLVAWLAVVEHGSVDGKLWVPVPFDSMRVLECAAHIAAAEAVAAGGHVPGEDIDFEGDDGVLGLLADLGGAVDGRDVEADAQDLITGIVAGTGAGAKAKSRVFVRKIPLLVAQHVLTLPVSSSS